MRKILTFVLLIITVTLYGQMKNDFKEKKQTINIDSVNHIFIRAYCSPTDSCDHTPYQLTNVMVVDLIERLNNSNSKDSCDFSELYYLIIHFKDGTIRDFKINGSLILNNSNECIDFKDNNFFENLWIESRKNGQN